MSNDELLELLKSDVDKFNQYRKENPKQEIDFEEADLRGVNLSGANLRGANLQYVDFREANLREADARGANFSWASLARANLQLMKIFSNQKQAIWVSLGLREDERIDSLEGFSCEVEEAGEFYNSRFEDIEFRLNKAEERLEALDGLS